MKRSTRVLIGLIMIVILILILVWRARSTTFLESSSMDEQPKIKIAEYISIPY